MTRQRPRAFPPPRRRAALRPALEPLENRSLLSMTITVNTAADENDPTDGTVSFREAIELSNGQITLASLSAAEQAQVFLTPDATPAPGAPPIPNNIVFNIPGAGIQTITVTGTPLPAITAPATIDGYSQPGSAFSTPNATEADINSPLIRISGSSLGPGTPGQGFDGLDIVTSNCQIDGLIVTGFSGFGASISGARSQGNWLLGNFFGTLPDPTSGRNFVVVTRNQPTLSNQLGGLRITSSNNRIGGNTPGLPNVFANNGYDASGNPAGGVGLLIDTPGGTGNLIQGNGVFNNAAQGIFVRSSNNTIGEAISGGGNSVGFNGSDGVLITGGPTVQGNGLLGNFIGTAFGTVDGVTKKGTTPFPNHGNGVQILNSPKNYVGGADPAARNVLGENDLDGVAINGALATGNRLLNNYVGFNLIGSVIYFLPNQNGISDTAPGTIIGDPIGGVGNFVDNNRLYGILLSGNGTSGTQIVSNVIGLNPGGGSAFPNAFDGIRLNDAPNVTIGGTTAKQRNTISSNNNGIYVSGVGSTGTVIQGNFIGTAVDGLTDLGNAVDGIILDNAPNGLIGGTVAGAGNVISGNNRGVVITGPGATRNTVQGNFIGTDLTGKAVIHNEVDGVFVTAFASNNLIGGLDPGAGNSIVHNAGAGVLVDSGTANTILGNGIFDNTGQGIISGDGTAVVAAAGFGIVLNPTNDANRLQPAPALTAVAPSGGATSVQGTLDADGNTTYTVQFFSSTAKDPSGFGQGQTFLFTTTVTTDANGHAAIVATVPLAVPSGQFVTATATDPLGNTSAFSKALIAVPVAFQLANATYSVNEADGAVIVTVTRTGGNGGNESVDYAVGGGTAVAGTDYAAVSGTLFFKPGDTSKTFAITIPDPHRIGGSVTANVTLSNATNGATVGAPASAVLTILDNDVSSLQFAPAPGPFNGSGTITYTVVRDSGIGTATVNYATADGTAVAGVNYVATSGTLTFVPGQTSQTITVTVLDDSLIHPSPLTFRLSLGHAIGGLLGANNTIVQTVIPSNNAGALQFATAVEAAAPGAASVAVTVVRVGGKSGAVSVFYTSGYGNAVRGVDYGPVSGTLSFAPGETVKVISVPLRGNNRPGPNATFDLVLSAAGGGARVGTPGFTVITITHPAAPPNPSDLLPPTVIGVQTVGGPQGIYAATVTFSKAMDPTRARNPLNYALTVTGGGSSNLSVGITSAVYDPAMHRVFLFFGAPVPPGGIGVLVLSPGGASSAGRGLADLNGNLLDGTGTGRAAGTRYVTVLR